MRALLTLGLIAAGCTMTVLDDAVTAKFNLLYPWYKSFGVLVFLIVLAQLAIHPDLVRLAKDPEQPPTDGFMIRRGRPAVAARHGDDKKLRQQNAAPAGFSGPSALRGRLDGLCRALRKAATMQELISVDEQAAGRVKSSSRHSVHRHSSGNAPQLVLTEMLDIMREMSGNGFRQEEVSAYRLGERFHAAGLVDGRADDREVQAIRGADVAEKDLTFVKDDARP